MSDRFYRNSFLILLCSALLLTYIGRYTDLDILFANLFFDASQQRFPLREQWFFAIFVHHWVKWFLIAAGIFLIALTSVDSLYLRISFIHKNKKQYFVVVASFLLIPLAISSLKKISIHACPWDLQLYGGVAPYIRFLDSLPAGVPLGHCFPAGHISSALWLCSLAVLFLPKQPKKAALVFAGGLLFAFFLGFAQQMRGAHFLTHNLWSVWWALVIICVLLRIFMREAKSAAAQ